MQMLPERRTVGALLAHLAQAMPQQEAVVFPPRRLTYAGLYKQATVVAGGLGTWASARGTNRAPDEHRPVDHHRPRPCPDRRARGGAQHVVAPGGFLSMSWTTPRPSPS